MVKVITVLLVASATSMIIWRRNSKKDQQKEAAAGIVILWGAVAMILAILRHVHLSPPTDWITVVMTPFYKPIVKWIKGGLS